MTNVTSRPSLGPKQTRPRAIAGSTRYHAKLDPAFCTPQPPSLQFRVRAPTFSLRRSASCPRGSGPSSRAARTMGVVSSSLRPARWIHRRWCSSRVAIRPPTTLRRSLDRCRCSAPRRDYGLLIVGFGCKARPTSSIVSPLIRAHRAIRAITVTWAWTPQVSPTTTAGSRSRAARTSRWCRCNRKAETWSQPSDRSLSISDMSSAKNGRLSQARGLSEQGREGGRVDVGRGTDLDVPHVLARALEQRVRVLQRRAAEEAELHVARVRVDVRNVLLPLHPAPVAPLHGLLKARGDALHQLAQFPDHGLGSGRLLREVRVERRKGLHPFHRPHPPPLP